MTPLDELCSLDMCGCVTFGWKWALCMSPVVIIGLVMLYLIYKWENKKEGEVNGI